MQIRTERRPPGRGRSEVATKAGDSPCGDTLRGETSNRFRKPQSRRGGTPCPQRQQMVLARTGCLSSVREAPLFPLNKGPQVKAQGVRVTLWQGRHAVSSPSPPDLAHVTEPSTCGPATDTLPQLSAGASGPDVTPRHPAHDS